MNNKYLTIELDSQSNHPEVKVFVSKQPIETAKKKSLRPWRWT